MLTEDGIVTEDDTVVTQETSILGAGDVMEGDVEQGLVEEDDGQVIKRGGGGCTELCSFVRKGKGGVDGGTGKGERGSERGRMKDK